MAGASTTAAPQPAPSRFQEWLAKAVGPGGVAGLSIYLVLLFLWGMCTLFELIQALRPAASSEETAEAIRICLLGPLCQFELSPDDADLGIALLAAVAGMLGALIHAGTSFTSYVGNRNMVRSWVLWYLFRPFIGAVLSVLFYFVVRGGLLGSGAGSEDVSIYGVGGFSAMVGMFSKQAIDKLKELFDTLFRSKEGEQRADPLTESKDTAEEEAEEKEEEKKG